MFIVFGTPRSGTTLLASSLAQNDSIVVPDETDFIVPLAFICDRIKNPDHGRRMALELVVNSERFPGSIGQYVSPAGLEEAIMQSKYSFLEITQRNFGSRR